MPICFNRLPFNMKNPLHRTQSWGAVMSEVRYLKNLIHVKKNFLILFSVMLSARSGGGSDNSSETLDSSHPGASIYAPYCSKCHGSPGQGLSASAINGTAYSLDHLTNTIAETMPPSNTSAYEGSCASDVANYIVTTIEDANFEDGGDDNQGSSQADDLSDFYAQNIEAEIVQPKCALCHNNERLAQETNLVLNTDSDNATDNLNLFSTYYSSDANAHANILSKVRGGSAHGGGVQLACDEEVFKNLQDFLQLLGRASAQGDVICSGSLFEGISLTNSPTTLRRSALIIAGRLPTDDEYTLAQTNDKGLKAAIKGLMSGDNFHEFLVRGANHNLLSKALIGDGDLKYADRHDAHYLELLNRSYAANIAGRAGDENADGEFIDSKGSSHLTNNAFQKDIGFSTEPLNFLLFLPHMISRESNFKVLKDSLSLLTDRCFNFTHSPN